MASQLTILTRARTFFSSLNFDSIKHITTYNFLCQDPQFDPNESTSGTSFPSTSLPPNPSSGSPLYHENWRSPLANPTLAQSLIPVGVIHMAASARIQSLSQTLDPQGMMDVFADWMTSQQWMDIKQLFECWIKSLDKFGKPNKPDVNLYNHYLRANLMTDATAGELIDLVTHMDDYDIVPNTASFNLVLKAMCRHREVEASEKLLLRMMQTGKESLPDDESYDLVSGLMLEMDMIESALKYIDLALKSDFMISMNVFTSCLRRCLDKGELDALVSIIERCKKMEQNKALCPSWTLCHQIAKTAMQADKSKLTFLAMEYMAKWIVRGENARPPVVLSVEEGIVVSALGTVSRTYNSILLDGSWAILRRSIRTNSPPNPESYLGKINAHASLGHLQKAFSTLKEFETAYGGPNRVEGDDLFSPFTSLYPLVVACSKKGFETLDSVYFQLENLTRADPPYKSVVALNCVVLGCANIWDLDRAYQTFEAISSSFGLTPDIHSYNALLYAFGKLKKTFEATRVFEHLASLNVAPNAKTYSLLVDAHLINRDPKAAISVIDNMVKDGFIPTRDLLKKVRRRCVREMDEETNKRVESFARQFMLSMGTETRRDILFNLKFTNQYA